MPKYLEDSPDLGAFVPVDEATHPNGAKMVEGHYEAAPGEPLCGVCGSRLEPLLNDAGKPEYDLEECQTQKACAELLGTLEVRRELGK